MDIFNYKCCYMNVLYADDDEDDRELLFAAIEDINPTIGVTLSKDGE